METNWNQLIELYLQDEFSKEGRIAFEEELQVNPELREELEMHQLIQSAAKRASQRTQIQQLGKSYLRNVRIKQFAIGIAIAGGVATGIIYWVQSKQHAAVTKPNQEVVAAERTEKQAETAVVKDTIIYETSLSEDNSSLIESTEGISAMEVTSSHSNASKNVRTSNPKIGVAKNEMKSPKTSDSSLKTNSTSVQSDTVFSTRPTETVLAYTNERLDGEVIQNKGSLGWTKKYDSIGKFNELYCGYALVMNDKKFGFVDRKGNLFIPLIYDEIVVTVNIQSSKNKNKRKNKTVLYIPKRSGSDVKYCEEEIPF
jgi:hypothetical protein